MNEQPFCAYDKYAGGWDADNNYYTYDDMGTGEDK